MKKFKAMVGEIVDVVVVAIGIMLIVFISVVAMPFLLCVSVWQGIKSTWGGE
jgi:hypothetical protein